MGNSVYSSYRLPRRSSQLFCFRPNMSDYSPNKKLINKVSDCEREANEGLVAVNPALRVVEGYSVVVRSDVEEVVKANKVALISGGGSGHEPAVAGYVGKGMLTAAVFGNVFTSPSTKQILAAIEAATQGRTKSQVLLIVLNYTGDRLNFAIALERAKSKGYDVELVVVAEDCALESVNQAAGRRGLAGVIFMYKIAGAMAESGMKMKEIVQDFNVIQSKMGTIGLSLTPCALPGTHSSLSIENDEIELGLGIHGEAGVKRIKMQTAKVCVSTMIDHMLNPQSATRLNVQEGDRIAVIVNNLGGISVLELNVVAKETILYLESLGFQVDRVYCGTFVTSLNMGGVSISVLQIDDKILKHLDSPTNAPAWRPPSLLPGERTRKTPNPLHSTLVDDILTDKSAEKISPEMSNKVFLAVRKACERIIELETELNDLDSESGDGDCGTTMARGAVAVLNHMDQLTINCPHRLSVQLGHIAEDVMGGSSGALYSLFFTSAASRLKKVSTQSFIEAWQFGLDTMMKYGGAQPGYRTLIDPLHGALLSFKEEVQREHSFSSSFKLCSVRADIIANSTKNMEARAGRASYVSKSVLVKPDPGASACASWMKAIADAL